MPQPVLRFAPSPNGELHLGHAFSALTTARWARRLGGRMLLRIEDIDLARTREAFVAQIENDLAWLGLDWEQPVRRQSQHFAGYIAATDRLERLGLLYPCFASRTEIADVVALRGSDHPRDPEGQPVYPGVHKYLMASDIRRMKTAGVPYALRIDMAKALQIAEAMVGLPLFYPAMQEDGEIERTACDPAAWGDVVIVRKDVPTSYHLAVVVDDAFQRVSHVTRGRDLLAATGIHRLLQTLLELPVPRYFHHDLIEGPDGRKLSKSLGDKSLRVLREEGATANDVKQLLGFK